MLSKDLGTRNRAAIGITEDTDAVAVVVSEETGLVSFVQGGQIRRGLDGTRLRAAILDAMEPGSRDAEADGERQTETDLTPEVRSQRSEVS
jgi:diadenylate cyclase